VAPKRKPVVNEAEEVSRLIGDIYDASLDPSLWSTVFAAATKYVGGSAAHLSARDMVGRSSHGYFASGHDPRFLEIYHEKYFKINPLFPTMVFFDVERTLSISDCLPHEDFCRSQFCARMGSAARFHRRRFFQCWEIGDRLFHFHGHA
jgi:hypothetical protein